MMIHSRFNPNVCDCEKCSFVSLDIVKWSLASHEISSFFFYTNTIGNSQSTAEKLAVILSEFGSVHACRILAGSDPPNLV
jgi:hypothetical protein